MKIINLLPQKELQELRYEYATGYILKFFTVLITSLVLFLLAAFITNLFIDTEISGTNTRITDLQRQLSTSNNQALEKEVVRLNTQMKNIKSFEQQHYYWSKALVEFGNLAPSDFHVDRLLVDRNTGKITVEGKADSRGSVLAFWSSVKKSSYFSNINFPLSNLEKPTDTPFTFTFSANISMINKP